MWRDGLALLAEALTRHVFSKDRSSVFRRGTDWVRGSSRDPEIEGGSSHCLAAGVKGLSISSLLL